MFSKFHRIFDVLTVRERKIFLAALAVFFVSFSASVARSFYNKTVLAPVEGGEYREGLVGQPTALNPLVAHASEVDQDLIELLFADVTELLETHKVSDSGQVWTVILKKDLRWSDGKTLTSDDVLFTLDAIKNPDTRSPLFPTWQGVVAERLSEREIKFTLKTPYAFFLDNLRELKIVPEHIFGAIPLANLRLSDYNFEPVGSGPYRFLRYEKRKDGFIEAYRLEINPYFSGDSSKITAMTLRFFPTLKEATAAFNAKTIDGLGGLEGENLDELKISHQVLEINLPRYYAVFLNQNSSLALKQKEVRTALNLAVDRNRIIQSVFRGHAREIPGPIDPLMNGFAREIYEQEPLFNREKAGEVLEKNKWAKNNEGVLVKTLGKNAVVLEFEMLVPDIPFLVETARLIKEDWGAVGVRLTPHIVAPEEISEEFLKTRNYQTILFGNVLKSNPDIFSFWHSSERYYPGLNLSVYENKTLDALLESSRRSFSPEYATATAELIRIQKLIAEEVPAIFLFSPNYLYATPKNLGGVETPLITLPSRRFNNVNEWFLKTARVFRE